MTSIAAARPDDIRRHNLALMLRHVHQDGALTRAELTRRLAVSRSTVGALVNDLVELRLVQESVPNGADRAGRPSHVVQPDPSGPFVVAVDLDVTHVTVATVGIGGVVLGRTAVDWLGDDPPRPEDAAGVIVDTIDALEAELVRGPAIAIGVSVPGTVERTARVIGLAPNLLWRDTPFAAMLADRLQRDVDVLLGNDADLAVIAEHQRGSGRGVDDLVYLLGRVGLGAGIIVNGRLLRGRAGHVGEIGHNVVDLAGPVCHCGNRGCLETYVGDAALLALAGRHESPSVDHVHHVFADARAGDDAALSAVRLVAGSLGQAVAELVNTIDPQRVLFGGSLSEVLAIAEGELVASLERFVFAGGSSIELVLPSFGADSPLLGAAEIAFETLLADPVSFAGGRS